MEAHNGLSIRPSGAPLWVVCDGQPVLANGLTDNNGEADDTIREEGTACHAVALAMAHGYNITEGMTAQNGVIVSEEMIDACLLYLGALAKWRIPVTYEQPIHIHRIYPGLTGTPDAHGVDYEKRILRVADLKFGYRYVDAFENWQLICYACGLLDLYNLNDLEWWVEFTIVQPRSYGHEAVRTWYVKASDLRAFINVLSNSAHRAMTGQGSLKVNPGCINCVARYRCEALQMAAVDAMSLSVQAVPLDLNPSQLSAELRVLQTYSKLLEARITGLESQATHMLASGQVVPWYEITHGVGRETWQSPEKEAEVLALGRMMGKDVSKASKAITPTQAKKVLPPELVALYSHRPGTGPKLRQLDAKKIRKTFQG